MTILFNNIIMMVLLIIIIIIIILKNPTIYVAEGHQHPLIECLGGLLYILQNVAEYMLWPTCICSYIK